MQRIERTKQFKRDYKRELKGRHRVTLENALVEVLQALINNQSLAEKHRDHALTGDGQPNSECDRLSIVESKIRGCKDFCVTV